MQLRRVDLPRAFSWVLSASGVLLSFERSLCAHASARGQETGGFEREPFALAGPAPQRPLPRSMAAPPFSGPRSRGATTAHHVQPHHHRPSAGRARTPRMGPPPGGTTTALCNDRWRGTTRRTTGGARAGGSGYGRRSHSRCPGSSRAWLALMELRAVDHIRCPASVGRRTYPGPPALARSLACEQWRATATGPKLAFAQRRTAATGRKHPFATHPRSIRRGSRDVGWSD